MLRTEKARRLHESRSCEMEKGGGRDPQALAAAASKAASERDSGTVEHGGNKHQ